MVNLSKGSSGYICNTGTIWNTRINDDSIRILYMETESVHSGNSDDRIRSGL